MSILSMIRRAALFSMVGLGATGLIACGEGLVEDENFEDSDINASVEELIDGDFEEKIRGGTPATRAPAGMVALMKIVERFPDGRVSLANTCGGTLVKNRTVLTAKHCVNRAAVARGDYVICAGRTNTNQCSQGDFAFVDRAKLHPTQDAALLILDRAMTKKSKARLATRAQDPSGRQLTTAFGFGRLKGLKDGQNQPNSFTSSLRKVSLKHVPVTECKAAWKGVAGINGAKLCIQSSRARGVCSGDSGGPAYYRGRQVGIASFVSATRNADGMSTCTGTQPDVFVRVSSIRSWVNNNAVK